MRLAEALIERAELQKKNAQLLRRIEQNTKVQEGEQPAENPNDLISEYEENMERLEWLIKKINLTNSSTVFDGGTISDGIAKRDCIGLKIKAYKNIYESATIVQERYSQKEVKFVRIIDAEKIQHTINTLAKEYRELDTKLQEQNWTVELL